MIYEDDVFSVTYSLVISTKDFLGKSILHSVLPNKSELKVDLLNVTPFAGMKYRLVSELCDVKIWIDG